MKISVIIPVYNEAAIVADTARTLNGYLSSEFGVGEYELIFSDDGSTDGTSDIIRALLLPDVTVIGYGTNRGKGCAVRTGMLAAKGEYALFTDCDLAYGTDIIGTFYDGITSKNADIALGSRRLHSDGYAGYTALRKLASKVYYRVVSILAGFRYSDSQCGIKCFRTETAKAIFSQCKIDGFAFDLEAIMLADRAGASVIELPVTIINHRASKVHVFRDTFRMLRDIMKIKRIHK